MMQKQFEDEAFLVAFIEKLVEIQLILDDLKFLLERHTKYFITIKDSITQVLAISRHTSGLDDSKVQATFKNYEDFLEKDGEE